MRSRLTTHRHILLAAGLYALVFTAMAPFSTNSIDRTILIGSAVWLAPVLALLALRSSAGIGYRLLSYAVALYPTMYAFRLLLTPVEHRDFSTFHLVVLFVGFYTLVAFVVVLAIAGFDMLDTYLRKRLSKAKKLRSQGAACQDSTRQMQ